SIPRLSDGSVNTRIAGNAEQLLDAGLLETAKQEVANLHSSAGAAGHRVCLLRPFGNLQGQWRDRKSSPRPSRIISALWHAGDSVRNRPVSANPKGDSRPELLPSPRLGI